MIKKMMKWKKEDKYLNLTDSKWKHGSKWQYTGLKFVNRPFKKWALAVALSIFLSGFILFIIPFINPITSSIGATKFLGRFG